MTPLLGSLHRFLNKSPADQARAIQATVRHIRLRHTTRRTRKLLNSNLAAPSVLSSRNRLYVVYRPDWDIDFGHLPELKQMSSPWVSSNQENNAGDLPRLYALMLNINQVMHAGVKGDFAELGVFRGNSAAVLAHHARQHGRSVFLFDTFEGFAAQDLTGVDIEKADAFADTSIDLVSKNVGSGDIHFVKGYFPGTITQDIAQKQFAVVHLDCDLYAPMNAGLQFLYERLTPGGLLIIHDYANPCWKGAKQAVDEFLPTIQEDLIIMPDKSGTAMIRKARRFVGQAA